jgi:hypothetical protein
MYCLIVLPFFLQYLTIAKDVISYVENDTDGPR